MPLEHSPSLKDFAQGMPPELPDPARGRRWARLLIVALSIALVGLLVVNLAQSRAVAVISGKGTITGQVLGLDGQPAVAELMIEQTDLLIRSAPDGRFVLDQVPAGERLLVVARDGVGVEYPVVVVAGASADIGTVRAETTAEPLP